MRFSFHQPRPVVTAFRLVTTVVCLIGAGVCATDASFAGARVEEFELSGSVLSLSAAGSTVAPGIQQQTSGILYGTSAGIDFSRPLKLFVKTRDNLFLDATVMLDAHVVTDARICDAKAELSGRVMALEQWTFTPGNTTAEIFGTMEFDASTWTWTGTREGSFTIDCAADGSATLPMSITVLPSATDDFVSGVTINDGGYATNDTKVDLTLSWRAQDYFDQVMVSNDGGFAASKRRIIDLIGDSVSWRLDSQSSERLSRTVYLRFHNAITNEWSGAVTDDIILDTTPPVIASAEIATNRSSRAGASCKINVNASDNRTGLNTVQVAKSKDSKNKVTVAYAKKVTVPTPAKNAKWIRVQDGAGNWSRWKALG